MRLSARAVAALALIVLGLLSVAGVILIFALAMHYDLAAVVLILGLPPAAIVLVTVVALAIAGWRVASVASSRVLLGVGAALGAAGALTASVLAILQWSDNRGGPKTGTDGEPLLGTVAGALLAFGHLALVLLAAAVLVGALLRVGRRALVD